jgi:histidine triad (HIT) family protein
MDNCLFCRIVAGQIPATMVARTDDAIAFRDLNPQAPTHILVIPTSHITSMVDADSDQAESILGKTLRLASQVAREQGLDAKGYRLVINSGPDAGQSVFHLHVHLLGGRQMTWPPG